MRQPVPAAVIVALTVLLVAAPAATQALPAGGSRAALYASTWDGSLKLVRLDLDTLRPLPGRRLPLAAEPLGWSFAPDRSRLVTGSTARGARLRFIDLRAMRTLGDVTISRRGSGVATAWVGPRRVLAVVVTPGCCGAGDTIVAAVDAERRRVLWRRRLGGSLQAGERLDGSLLLVLGPRGFALGQSRLVQVGPDGPVRSAELPEIISGTRPAKAVTHSWTPGLAVDRPGSRAFIVQARAPVAEVDLRTFEVQSHPLPPEAGAADALAGPQRDALWLGRGTLAITGSDRRDNPGRRAREAPAGLTLVDTDRWLAREIHAKTTDVELVAGMLLASCYLCDSPGGLTGFSVDGRRRFHLFERTQVVGVQALGRKALVGSTRGITLIDARTGRALRRYERFAMTLLRDDAPFP
jgi:hypothetical protein